MTSEDHTGGPVPCDQVGMFVDGELDETQAETFRQHLVDCARCQGEMHALMQLAGLAEEVALQKPAPPAKVPHPAFLRSWWRRAPGMAALAAVAVVAFVVVQRQRPEGAADLLAKRTARRVSGWPSYAGAREYLPYVVQRGGAADDLVPGVSKLEERHDWAGLASVALVRGDFRQALAYLQRAPKDGRTQNDVGLALLELGQPEAALEAFDGASKADPALLQPAFNRSLALQRLGLPHAALQSLREVMSRASGGWQTEADSLSGQLQGEVTRRAEEMASLLSVRRALGEHQEPPDAVWIARAPGSVRRALYSAVAIAPDDRALERLLPVARELDALSKADTLQSLVSKARATATPERWRLASALAPELRQPATLSLPEKKRLADELRRAHQTDQLLLLASLDFLDETLGFPALARESTDPFWTLRVLAREARRAQHDGKGGSVAPRVQRELQRLCQDPSLGGECANVLNELALVHLRLDLPEAALRSVDAAARFARNAPDPIRDRTVLLIRGEIQVQSDRLAAARGVFDEVTLSNPGDCGLIVYAANELSTGFVNRGDAESARKYFQLPASCITENPDPSYRVRIATELAVLEDTPAARIRAEQEIARVPQSSLPLQWRHDLALAGATLLSESDDPQAETAFIAAQRVGQDLEKSGSEDYLAAARTSLLFWYLRRGLPEPALRALAELNETEVPPNCVLGAVAEFDRRAWIARGPSGELFQAVDAARTGDHPPQSLVERLRACTTVTVLANAPLLGKANLLDPSVAWSFATGRAAKAPVGHVQQRLRIRGALPPPELELPPVGGRSGISDTGWTVLQGADATPARVRAAMREADLIDFEVHGMVRAELPDGALLALSSSPEGYALTALDVEATPLQKTPIVFLGSCRAAAGSAFRVRPWNLPASFRRAGARAVFASLSELPDDKIGAFFAAVSARLDGGAAPSLALRDERQAWMNKGQTWVNDVVLFE